MGFAHNLRHPIGKQEGKTNAGSTWDDEIDTCSVPDFGHADESALNTRGKTVLQDVKVRNVSVTAFILLLLLLLLFLQREATKDIECKGVLSIGV